MRFWWKRMPAKAVRITDREYMQAGAHIVEAAAEVWSKADLVVKVKEPQPAEYPYFRPGLILFTYLHLAPLPELTDRLLDAQGQRRRLRDHPRSATDRCRCSRR